MMMRLPRKISREADGHWDCVPMYQLHVAQGATRVVSKNRVPFGVLFIGVPYYIGNITRDSALENYPI